MIGGAITSITIPETVETIGENAIGYSSSGEKIGNFKIYGVSGSAAETYALENGMTFNSLPEGDSNGDGKLSVRDAAAIAKFLATGKK